MNTSLRIALVSLVSLGAIQASAKVTEKFQQTYPLTANGVIRLESVNGSVEVETWDRPEVAVEAEKGARDAEAMAQLRIEITAQSDRLAIRTEHEKSWAFWKQVNSYVNYKLRVPAGVTLEKISLVNSNIQVRGVTGPMNLETVNGRIGAEGAGAPGHFATVNGSVDITYARLPAATDQVELKTVNGSCALTLPADAAFRLEANTLNGHVSCEFPITLTKAGKFDLNGEVNGGGVAITMKSVNGGVKVLRAKTPAAAQP